MHWRVIRPGRFTAGVICGLLLVAVAGLVVNRTTIPDRIVGGLIYPDTRGNADAIVVLGAGVIGDCEPNLNAVRRVLLALDLWRAQRAPLVLFTGGRDASGRCVVANVMADLARSVGIPGPAIRVETGSRTTHENATGSAPLLRELGARRLLLVTDRLHMRRSAGAFEQLGFGTERATVPVYAGHPDNWSMLKAGLREYVALAVYAARGWVAPIQRQPLAALGLESSGRLTMVANDGRVGMEGSASQSAAGPVVVLGASYAGGWHPALPGVEVVNKGVSGQQSFELLQRFDRDVAQARPRAVVIWGFINDVMRSSREEIDAKLERTRQSYVQMIGLARQHGIEPILATEVTVPVDRSLTARLYAWIGAIRGKESYQAWVNRHVLRTNLWIRELARKEGLLLLDLQPVLADADGARRPQFADPDGSHLTAAAYAALSRYAQPLLAGHLAGRS